MIGTTLETITLELMIDAITIEPMIGTIIIEHMIETRTTETMIETITTETMIETTAIEGKIKTTEEMIGEIIEDTIEQKIREILIEIMIDNKTLTEINPAKSKTMKKKEKIEGSALLFNGLTSKISALEISTSISLLKYSSFYIGHLSC